MLKRSFLPTGTGILISICTFSLSMIDDDKNHFIVVATKYEQRSVIHYCVTCGKKPVKIYQKLHRGYGDNALSNIMVWKWVKKFQEGRKVVHDEAATLIKLFSLSFTILSEYTQILI